MKTKLFLVIAFVLATTGIALAEETPLKRPDNLVCRAESKNPVVQIFKILDMNSDRPGTDIDARVDGRIEDEHGITSFAANNGCDNNYTWIFFSQDLDQMARGERKWVEGLMTFANSSSECVDSDNGCEGSETARVTCVTVKKE